MQGLEGESTDRAATAAIIFNVKPSSIRMGQLRLRHQQRNSRGTFDQHGGNNLILTTAQEEAVLRFCSEQLEMGLGATLLLIYAAICYLGQQEKLNPPSLVWSRQWLKKHSTLHTIKTKPIAHVRLTTHSEEDLKTFFV